MKKTAILIGMILITLGCAGVSVKQEGFGIQSPDLLALRSRGGGRVEIFWTSPSSSQAVQEYRLYIQRPKSDFELLKSYTPDKLKEGVHSDTIDRLATKQLYFFKMTSVIQGEEGLVESIDSIVLPVLPPVTTNKVLVVKDNPESDNKDTEIINFGESLNSLEKPFDACQSKLFLLPDTPEGWAFDDYDIVLWTCGEGQKGILQAAQREILKKFLDQEGRLFICGNGIGSELAGSSASAESRQFYQDYLKSFYDEDWSSISKKPGPLVAVEGQRYFNELQFPFSCSHPGRIEPYGGSDTVLYYNNIDEASGAAVAYVGNFGTPNVFSRMVYMGIPWNAIHHQDEREIALQCILNYLENAGPLKYVAFIEGSIKDAKTGELLTGAKIHLAGGTSYSGSAIRTKTREDGTFRLAAMEGTYHFIVEMDGYQTGLLRNVKVQQGKPYRVDLTLKRQ